MQPVDALGAIARCRQIVVVGDQRQLPPTNFFGRVSGESDVDEDDDGIANAGDLESIMDCVKLKVFLIECCDGIIEAVTSHSLLLAIDSSMRIDFLLSQAR